jgi:hypothetical protein
MTGTVKRIVSKVATDLGYRRGRGSNWYKDFADVIQIVGLQKSRWGGQNYLEAGIWLKVFGPDESPSYYECHVRLRLDNDSGLDLGDVDSALDEEASWKMESEERQDIIKSAIVRAEMDFFGKARTLEDLHSLLGSRHELNLAVDRQVKDFFQMHDQD